MSRLSRFQEYRFVGARDTMRVYDCDDAEEFGELERRVNDEDMVGRKLLQSFAPDTVEEARSRGFKPRDRRFQTL